MLDWVRHRYYISDAEFERLGLSDPDKLKAFLKSKGFDPEHYMTVHKPKQGGGNIFEQKQLTRD